MTAYKWLALVDNPYHPDHQIYLGVADSFKDAMLACHTEAEASDGHEHASDLIAESDANILETHATSIGGVMWDNGDGITYWVKPVWDIDGN